MKRALAFLTHALTLAAIGFLLLAALIWWAGPLLQLGGDHPLDGIAERVIALLVLLAIFAAVFGFRAWRRRSSNKKLVKGLAGGPSSVEREAQALEQRFTQAIKVLGESARQTGKSSWLRRGQYLYELPWFMFIGLPGSGKSTVGRLLAGRLDIPFADVDHAIQDRAGMSVSELFSQRGEAAFRELESEVLQSLIAAGPSVIATGGGTVLKPENRSLLKERTLAVYLEASLPELWRRVRRSSRRPLLQVADPQAKLAELYVQLGLTSDALAALDEVATLRRDDELATSSGYLRGHGVMLMTLWQSEQQKLQHYGDHEALTPTMGVHIHGRPEKHEDAERLSRALGQFSTLIPKRNSNGGKTSEHPDINTRSLLTATEVKRLPRDYNLIFSRGLTIRARKFPYYKNPTLDRRSRLAAVTTSDVISPKPYFIEHLSKEIGVEKVRNLKYKYVPLPEPPEESEVAIEFVTIPRTDDPVEGFCLGKQAEANG